MTRVSERTSDERHITPGVPLLLRSLRENYRGGGWHGPSVRDALSGLDSSAARWRPGANRHNIWELTIHLAYARHIMLTRMGVDVPAFPHRLTKAWWPELPAVLTPATWVGEVALLEALHRRLMAAVSDAGRRVLGTVRPRRNLTIAMEVLGVATHDAYHAGQMQMIRRMWESKGPRSGR